MTKDILRVENLTVDFSGFKAITNLDFSMQEGELRVVIGPNGAGKTTLCDAITGKVSPTSGKIFFHDEEISHLPEYKIARKGIGRKFQTPRVFLNLSVYENVELAHNRTKGVLKTLFSKRTPTERERIMEVLETCGLADVTHRLAGILAHGQKQWLEIAMMVAQDPDLLLLDECVAGMTDKETEATGELIESLAKNHAILVIEHDMVFVRQIAKLVTVLHQGQTLCEGTFDQVQQDSRVIEVYLGSHKAEMAAVA
ncbi:MAG: urea ABC transporter ATP-binding protein UrtD [Synechococcaceae cyanobacterium SM2_3_2]|nr:urea ABC transporter ATP-binding protein UrtD [Synechococcaceae cyanobacterium SM2_3_2]